mmetsp:Transcript_32174/g.70892  ORF Transcript_32174/g.70892 Transcript_32174/m.70892 type:complete len:212 (+) Transcript_32174:160-795(+)
MPSSACQWGNGLRDHIDHRGLESTASGGPKPVAFSNATLTVSSSSCTPSAVAFFFGSCACTVLSPLPPPTGNFAGSSVNLSIFAPAPETPAAAERSSFSIKSVCMLGFPAKSSGRMRVLRRGLSTFTTSMAPSERRIGGGLSLEERQARARGASHTGPSSRGRWKTPDCTYRCPPPAMRSMDSGSRVQKLLACTLASPSLPSCTTLTSRRR